MNKEKQNGAISTEVILHRRKENHIVNAWREAYTLRLHQSSELLFDLLFGFLACMLTGAHAVFGVYPFGIALLASTERRVLPIFAGTVIGCYFLGSAGALYLAVFCLILVARLFFSYPTQRRLLPKSQGLFREEWVMRVLVGALFGGFMALYELVLFGAKDYTILFAIGSLLLCPLLTLLYTFVTASGMTVRVFMGKEAWECKHPFLLQIGAPVLLFSAALAFRPLTFFGISLGNVAISLFVLLISRRFGALRGCAAGLLIGLAGNLSYLPVFGILGLLSGIYTTVGMPLALGMAVLSGGAYAGYVGGVGGFLETVPEMAVTALLAWPFLRTLPKASADFFKTGEGRASPSEETAQGERREKTEEDTLACLSGAFFSVSETLERVANEEKTPTAEEYEALCLRAKEDRCRRCPAEGACTEAAAVKSALQSAVIRLSCGESVPDAKEPPCEGFSKMVEDIRQGAAELIGKKRQGGARGALSVDYALLSRILRESAEEKAQETERDSQTEAALQKALSAQGISVGEIRVIGKRSRRILLRDIRSQKEKTVDEATLLSLCTRVCGKGLSRARMEYDGRTVSCFLESRPCFEAEGGIYTHSHSDTEPSGDRAICLSTDSGMAYGVLSDGMGSGKGASRASELCISVLSTLLAAGVKRDTAMSMLNNLIRTGTEECSVALDLLALDLLTGKASFHKSGAAASFVHRQNALFRIRSRTIPMGLMRILDTEEAGFDLCAGDTIILLSDGVMGGNEEGGWLKELLSHSKHLSAHGLAQAIVEKAVMIGGRTDDMTAVVIQVTDKG